VLFVTEGVVVVNITRERMLIGFITTYALKVVVEKAAGQGC
jgi:hypothetical protein